MGNKITFRFLFLLVGLVLFFKAEMAFAQCEDAKLEIERTKDNLTRGLTNAAFNRISGGKGDAAVAAAQRNYDECMARVAARKEACENEGGKIENGRCIKPAADKPEPVRTPRSTIKQNTDEAIRRRCSEKGGNWDQGNTACVCPGGRATGEESNTIDPMSADKCSVKGKSEVACEKKGGRYERESDNCICGESTVIDPNIQSCNGAGSSSQKSLKDQCALKKGTYNEGDGEDSGASCTCEGNAFDPFKTSCGESAPQALVQCLDQWKERAKDCEEAANNAAQSCDGEKSNDENVKFAKGMATSAKQNAIAKNAGKGAKELCAETSILANSVINGLDLFKKTCDKDFSDCSAKCELVNESTQGPVIYNDCYRHVRVDENSNSENVADMTLLSNTISLVNNSSVKNRKICKEEAGNNKFDLGKLFKQLDDAGQSAAICACKLSSTQQAGTEKCNDTGIPTPSDCLPGGKLAGTPGCGAFSVNCTDPAQRLTDVCACIVGSASCKAGAVAKVNDSVFGADIKQNGSGASNFAGTGVSTAGGKGLGGGPGGFDLSLPKKPIVIANSNGSAAGLAGGGIPIGGSSGGFGAGGSLGTGGLGNRDGASTGADEESHSIGGAYGQAKSFFSSLLGGKNSKDDKNASKNKNGKVNGKDDMDRFRPKGPIRGVAGTSSFGSKHMDIFKMVNIRYNNKHDTFISTK